MRFTISNLLVLILFLQDSFEGGWILRSSARITRCDGQEIPDMTESIPEGFKPYPLTGGFVGHNGPYYFRQDDTGVYEFGFQTDDRHGNPYGFIHGGAVLGFLDTMLGGAVFRETRRRCATISLDSRFIAGAAPGVWITAHITLKKVTRAFAFVDGEAFAGDRLLVTAAAVFRIFED
jgi:acyl-coenzyme A thioesterase PaaI-like protein